MKQPDNVTVKLTLPEVDSILFALGERPFNQVANLINNLRAQVQEKINQHNEQQEAQAQNAGGTD